MALYFKDIEITKLRDLAPQPGLDITDLWFGETNVYTAWQTYEGTLPATLNANGANMRQYQVYGNTGGVGDRTVQLFDKNATDTSNGYAVNRGLYSGGTTANVNGWNISEYIPISANQDYVFKNLYGNSAAFCIYDSSKQYIWGEAYENRTTLTFNSGNNASYIRFNIRVNTNMDTLMLTPGTSPPETFVPYGYEVDMGVKSGNLLSFDALINAPSGKLSNYSFSHVFDLTLKPNTTYTAVSDGAGSETETSDSSHSIYINDFATNACVFDGHPVTVQTSADGVVKIGIQSERQNAQQYINGTAHVWLVEGSDALPYQPYSNTITPIYIGGTALQKDEYVDYTEQKVYRRTVNEFDKDNATVYNAYISISTNKWINVADGSKTVKIPCLPQTQYTLSVPSVLSVFRIAESENSDIEPTTSGSTISIITQKSNNKYTFTTAQNTQALIFQGNGVLADEWFNGLMLVKGDTAPETYTPYLQPTNPPVTLPELPTCEGTTIVDYAGSGTAPEKMFLKYRKEGY